MATDIILCLAGSILMILGVIGCILPVLPGPVLSYIGILLLHFTSTVNFSSTFLIGWAIVVALVELADYYVPIWGAKKFGGGKKGAIGCTVGVILGVFLIPPWGIIIFPFLGAVIGELIDKKPALKSLKAGFGSFIGFVAGTMAQLAVALVLLVYFVTNVIHSNIF